MTAAEDDFDMQAAWLRRFAADAESSLGAFAHRLDEALPGAVTLHRKRSLFARQAPVVGFTVALGDRRYGLGLENGRLEATVSLVVRGIALNTRRVAPADWFAQFAAETRTATAEAGALSRSLADFMAR